MRVSKMIYYNSSGMLKLTHSLSNQPSVHQTGSAEVYTTNRKSPSNTMVQDSIRTKFGLKVWGDVTDKI